MLGKVVGLWARRWVLVVPRKMNILKRKREILDDFENNASSSI
jgi:hypothetical protein